MTEFPLLSDERIDAATLMARDDYLDFVYENGSTCEGHIQRIRKIARAAESEARAPLLAEIERLTQEVERLNASIEFRKERSAQREKRLWHWAHEELPEPLKTRYFNIVANGTADIHEQPIYAQQFNQMKYRAEAAEKQVERLKADAERLDWCQRKLLRIEDMVEGEARWDVFHTKGLDQGKTLRAAIDAARAQGGE